MSGAVFDSSDSVRSGAPLKHAQYVALDEPLKLELGGELPDVTVCYETYGALDADARNAVLICHALSGDSHVARHDPQDQAGWWEIVVGPGKPIDTNRFFVICPNLLGSCRGTTGPNQRNPATGAPYGQDFPNLTVRDMVAVQKRLLEHLGIRRLLAVVGGSMGGQQVLQWATQYPESVLGAIPIATGPRLTSQSLAFDIVGRNAIFHDPQFQNGQYYAAATGPGVGLAIARMIGHITYLSPELMQRKFESDRYAPRDVPTTFETAFSVGSYLGYQGDKFVERFDANSYIVLTKAMDRFDLGASAAALATTFAETQCRWLCISFSSDWLFPPEHSAAMVQALLKTGKRVTSCNVTSICGHDAFLLADDLHIYGELIRGFLENLLRPRCCETGACPQPGARMNASRAATSIFHGSRFDYARILSLIPADASVLDLGCGEGRLLCRLKQRGHSRVTGVEIDEKAILSCVQNGHDVIHADLNRHLNQFGDSQFDVVVLSLTLQAVLDVEGVLGEMLRIGRRGIVSFPNFAYRKLRRMLAEQGRAPESPGQLHYKWYNTPNLRFFSIVDFEELCRDKGIEIHEIIALDTEAGQEVRSNQNLDADLAICVVSAGGHP